MNDEAVKHLPDGSDVAFQEYGDGPVVVTRHCVQEPAAGGH